MRIIDCEQGSPLWHESRAGRVTGSRVADIMRRTKSGVSATRNTYLGELAAERLSGAQESGFSSKAMDRGKEMEPKAAQHYAFINNADVQTVGLVIHPTIDMAAASPDRLVLVDGVVVGGVEIKVPNTATHIATILGGDIDPDYMTQMQWGMACTGLPWWDFVSFDDRLPPRMAYHCRRVHRDSARIMELQTEVRKFLAELDDKIAALKAKYPEPQSEAAE